MVQQPEGKFTQSFEMSNMYALSQINIGKKCFPYQDSVVVLTMQLRKNRKTKKIHANISLKTNNHDKMLLVNN